MRCICRPVSIGCNCKCVIVSYVWYVPRSNVCMYVSSKSKNALVLYAWYQKDVCVATYYSYSRLILILMPYNFQTSIF